MHYPAAVGEHIHVHKILKKILNSLSTFIPTPLSTLGQLKRKIFSNTGNVLKKVQILVDRLISRK